MEFKPPRILWHRRLTDDALARYLTLLPANVLPVEPDYEQELKSEIADIKQCGLGADADHILAAVFLGKFIAQDCPWIHLDLAARKHKGGLAHIPTEVSGFGVRYTLSLLLEQRLLARLP